MGRETTVSDKLPKSYVKYMDMTPDKKIIRDKLNLFRKQLIRINYGGARGVMVIVVGNGHGDTSSNPGQDWLHFTYH